jgi:hypothetical protein
MRKLIALSLVIFCLSGCKKAIDNKYPEFIGSWYTLESLNWEDYEVFVVEQDGTGRYKHETITNTGTTTSSSTGRVRANKRKVRIGLRNFKIQEYPRPMVGNFWRMRLDNTVFYCDKDYRSAVSQGCNEASIDVLNNTSDTIMASFTDRPTVAVAPQSSLYTSLCLGCTATTSATALTF